MTGRLDAELAARGLSRSRTHAAQLISEGRVSVDGTVVTKPSLRVDDDADVQVAATDHYVSRAAHKLIAALDGFDVPVADRVALDMGASTGGFTQVLCERGARHVYAIDVGHDQMSPVVARDPRVTVVEGFNARELSPDSLADAVGSAEAPGMVTGDLSFISLTHVLPGMVSVLAPDADVVLLVKPQFEVGRQRAGGGVVSDPGARADAVATVLWAAWDAGLRTRGVLASPLPGTHGNREYLVHLSAQGGGDPSEWTDAVNDLTGIR